MLATILLIILTLLFSALFSGIEIAFLSANKLKVELSYQRGTLSGKILNDYIKHPSKFIVTTLLGNNIALIAFGILSAKLMEPLLEEYLRAGFFVLLIQTIISTVVVLFLGEFIPKVIFKVFADSILPVMAVPFRIIHWVLTPGVFIINGLSTLLFKLAGVKVSETDIQFTSVDLEKFIKDHSVSEEEEEEVDTELFENALYLKKLRVRDCMVPRREITAIDISEPVEELKKIIIETYHSRILIFDDNIDKIVGYIHHFDLHKKPADIASILMPIKVVPEAMHIQKLLNEFIKENKSIAWVVNEYGGTAGVITLEDILEEIFGEIDDEYDKDELVGNQLSKNEFILSGRLEIDRINEDYNLDLPEGDYDTLSGFIIDYHETIPEKNEVIEIGKYTFKIMDVSETKIETVKMVVQQDAENQ
ncbi:MAG TPA: hemolysin family protein [Chitinophagales bacterium]|jgi:CBS domain containing-hemolysin-like protein|nr:hemolysin family protein [Chitinophagales bacterium]HQO32339.1 hemolysin family protein [Chitinophagales bacterium]HQO89249.1 hemolysin family protein [Chitinophagales bacterium]